MKAFWPAFPFTDGLYFLLLGWFDIFMCMWLSKLKSWLLHSWTLCFFLCSRVKELKRAREHETPQKSSLAMWHHSPDSSFLFCLYPRHFTRETERKKKKETPPMQALQLLLLLQCYWFNCDYIYNSIFFTYLFFPLTWFWLESGNFYRIIN